MPNGYPILLSVSNRSIVIVGAGSVAARKANGLIEAGATRIRIIAPEIRVEMPAGVEIVREPYDPKHLDGASLVFAATDSKDVNDAVRRDAQARGILVNQADDPAATDFSTPAVLRRGAVAVSVSAGSAALAVTIRDGIAQKFDARWSQMADAMQQLRPMILTDLQLDEPARQRMLRALASDEAINLLSRDGIESLKNWIQTKRSE
jgi:precorrin-2 dehydrogenase/sirohydrochlorin ferrochelatase